MLRCIDKALTCKNEYRFSFTGANAGTFGTITQPRRLFYSRPGPLTAYLRTLRKRRQNTLKLYVLIDFAVEQAYKEERFEGGVISKAKLTVPYR